MVNVLLKAINNECYGNDTSLGYSQHTEEALQPILREEAEIAVAIMKKEKSAGVDNIPVKSGGADNIPTELVQAGGKNMIDALTKICKRSRKQDNG